MSDGDLQLLMAEREISKAVFCYGRTMDTDNWQRFRECLADPINIKFTRLTGQPETRIDLDMMMRYGSLVLSPMRVHHVYTNLDITVTGEKAHALVYMTARHWRAVDLGLSTNTQYGWYNFSLERFDGRWLITRIEHDFQWVDGNTGVFDYNEPKLLEMTREVFSEKNCKAANDWLAEQG